MPIRDEQEYESRRQQIMDGALRVFSRKGFEEATNKEIAQAANIGSPGLIYHYFKDKQDLFRTLVEERIPALQLLLHSDELMDLPPREVLTRLASAFLETMSNRMALSMFRLMLGEATRRPEVAEILGTIGPVRAIGFLRQYLADQMEKGTLRQMDPGVAARALVGPLVVQLLTREVFHLPGATTISNEAMVAATIDIFLQGMEVHQEPSPAE